MSKNSSFNTFVSRLKDFEFLKKYSDRVQILNGKKINDITSLPYDMVKHEIPALLSDGKFQEVLDLIAGEKVVGDKYDKLKFLFFLLDQYKVIQELEQQYLSSPPDPKLIAAGIQELDILGDINIIDALAGGDVLKWSEIRLLPYSTIFDKQLKMTIENRITKRMQPKTKGN